MSNRRSYDVFLSYAMADREWVSAFAASLGASGVAAWFDVAMVEPGELWQDELQQALRESRVFVVVVSSHTMDSRWVLFELGAAMAGGKRIIPVLVDDAAPDQIPIQLEPFQFVRAASPEEAGRRVAAVVEQTKRPQAAPSTEGAGK